MRSTLTPITCVESLKTVPQLPQDQLHRDFQAGPGNNPDKIVFKGVPPESSSDLRTIVHDRLPEYDLTSGAGKHLDGLHEAAGLD